MKNRFGTIPGGYIQIMIFRNFKAHVSLVSSLSIYNSMKRSLNEPKLLRVREGENVCGIYAFIPERSPL